MIDLHKLALLSLASTVGFGLPGPIELMMIAVQMVFFGFWIWMIVDCAINESREGNDRIVWMLVILFLCCLGALIYFFVRYLPRTARS